MSLIKKYYHWLHGQWPAGKIEKLPEVGDDGETNVPGIRVIGDLSGIPLLKFSSDTGARAIRAILAEPSFPSQRESRDEKVFDVAIIGAGVSGISAAMEAAKAGLKYVLIEATQAFSTVANFPKGKPIFTYPSQMTPAGGIQYSESADTKEKLLDEMRQQVEDARVTVTTGRVESVDQDGKVFVLKNADDNGNSAWRALRVVVAIGRSGNFRKLGIPGEELDKVSNRLHDPSDFAGKQVLVVGGGDSAAESAIALACAGAHVTLSYRNKELNRPKPENVKKVHDLAENPDAPVGITQPVSERVTTAFQHSDRKGTAGKLILALGTKPSKIGEKSVVLTSDEGEHEIPNDAVFSMIGREAPLEFFQKSGVRIRGDRGWKWWATISFALLFAIWLYHWKKYLIPGLDPHIWMDQLKAWWGEPDPKSFLFTLQNSASGRSFYYSLAYSILILVFGVRRIRRRNTPYVTRQTMTLMSVQWLPLFLLPELLLPWAGQNGWFDTGIGAWIEGQFFPGESYWRSYGFILAWPLAVFNWFTDAPIWGWLVLGAIQTFVIIPWIVHRWGKGAYCGWICSCGALAETMGDNHRHKMPHGPAVNRFNMIGQVFLAFAAVIMVFRILGWIFPATFTSVYQFLLQGPPLSNGLPLLSYNYLVDLLFAGVFGVAFYFHFSGRIWCRFACPLAALMHIYARFTRFRIFAEKKKCISCNVCTTVCHQGIDVMNFANKGKPMVDPECVRCSACVQSCPTGVLTFGRLGEKGLDGERKILLDRLPASPVRMKEESS